MNKKCFNTIMLTAYTYGIEVKIAKTMEDMACEGFHILNPSLKQLMDELDRAIFLGEKLIVVHSKETWPLFN